MSPQPIGCSYQPLPDYGTKPSPVSATALPTGLRAGEGSDTYTPPHTLDRVMWAFGALLVVLAMSSAAGLGAARVFHRTMAVFAFPAVLLIVGAALLATAKHHHIEFRHTHRCVFVTTTRTVCRTSTTEEIPFSDVVGLTATPAVLRRRIALQLTFDGAPAVPLGAFPDGSKELAAWRQYIHGIAPPSQTDDVV